MLTCAADKFHDQTALRRQGYAQNHEMLRNAWKVVLKGDLKERSLRSELKSRIKIAMLSRSTLLSVGTNRNPNSPTPGSISTLCQAYSSDMTSHMYWTYCCKTEGCRTRFYHSYVGIFTAQPIAHSQEDLRPFQRKCDMCGRSYTYNFLDLKLWALDHAPAGPNEMPPPSDDCI